MAKTTERWTPEGKRFMQELEKLKKLTVKIGYQDDGKAQGKEVRMLDIAAWNELGTVNMPARPFMRDSVDNHKQEIEAFAQAQMKRLVGGATAENILADMGVMQQALMQNEITQGSFTPDAKSTIRKKKSDKPLIDTGRMRQSIHFIIKKKEAD